MLLMSHFVMYWTLGWEVRKICLICCGCNEDPPITVTPLHIHAHKGYKQHTLQQHCHINTCSNARPQFWELCNSATYYPNIQSAWCVSEVSNWTQLKVGQFKNADNSALWCYLQCSVFVIFCTVLWWLSGFLKLYGNVGDTSKFCVPEGR